MTCCCTAARSRKDATGRAFVQKLALLTGADVAASTDTSGTTALGGNWTLEYATGRIEAAAIDGEAIAPDWAGLLAIDVGSTTSSMTTGATSLGFAHTIAAGANGMLLVSVGFQANSGSVTGITYNGVALSLLDFAEESGGGRPRAELWYLKAPPVGTANVVVSMSASMEMTAGATSFFGVDQTTSTGPVATATGNGHAPSVNVTSAPGELVFDSIEVRAGAGGSPAAGQTELHRELTGTAGGDSLGASSTKPGASSVTMSWSMTGSGAGGWASVGVSLKPAPNTAPTLVDASVVTLAGTNEDTTSASTTVASLLSGAGAADADHAAVSGMAVTSVTANGNWQYSTDGASWTSFGSVSAANSLLLDAASRVRYLPDGLDGETASFTFRAWDQTTGTASPNGMPAYASPGAGGGNSAYSAQSATGSLTVTAINDAPVVTAGGTLAYAENQAATAIDSSITVTDIDNGNLASATVSISANHAVGQDSLIFTNQNNISGSWNAGTGVLSLSGVSSLANYQTALRSVAYVNASDNPSTLNRTISFVVNDGSANSPAATSTVTITAVNDAPTASNLSTAQSYTEDTPLALTPIVITDPDSANVTATLTLSNPAAGSLNVGTSGAVSSTYNAATGGLDCEWRNRRCQRPARRAGVHTDAPISTPTLPSRPASATALPRLPPVARQ